jgi:PTH1 family peptidyl-tRNA hydrolase
VDLVARTTHAARAEGAESYDMWRAPGERAEPAVLLVKPRTFMNGSGVAVAELLRREPITLDSLLVICDDVNLPLGRVRIRPRGSEGGHNGLLSIIETLGTAAFPRLRLGVGPRPPEPTLTEFVLEEFSADEEEVVQALVARGAEAALAFAREGIEQAMRGFNGNDERR